MRNLKEASGKPPALRIETSYKACDRAYGCQTNQSPIAIRNCFTSAHRVLNEGVWPEVLEKIYLLCRRRYTYFAREVYPL